MLKCIMTAPAADDVAAGALLSISYCRKREVTGKRCGLEWTELKAQLHSSSNIAVARSGSGCAVSAAPHQALGRCAQVHTLLKGLEKIAASADIPMLVAGDFNSTPGSAAHALLVKRAVDPSHPVRRPLQTLQKIISLHALLVKRAVDASHPVRRPDASHPVRRPLQTLQKIISLHALLVKHAVDASHPVRRPLQSL